MATRPPPSRSGRRYHGRLIALARRKLRTSSRRTADEEDVVQNAFHSFFRGVSRGRFPKLDDRDNLWRLLVVITARKAIDQLAHELSRRQGGGSIRLEPRMSSLESGRDEAAVARIVGDEPTPKLPPRSRRSTSGSWTCLTTIPSGGLPSGRWRASPARRWQDG